MKPRCQGARTPGHFTSFDCVLDDGHAGYCQPYVAPSVDEWRAVIAERGALRRADAMRAHGVAKWEAEVARLQAELDALRAILASGCDACAHSAPKHPVSQEATLAEMRGALDDDGRDLDAETVAGVQAARDDLRGLAGKVET